MEWNGMDWNWEREVIFVSTIRSTLTEGFGDFHSLSRIIIPRSVRMVKSNGCLTRPSLTEVIFESGTDLRVIYGFSQCRSLSRIGIPSAVESIDSLLLPANSVTIRATSSTTMIQDHEQTKVRLMTRPFKIRVDEDTMR
jgi:hypothetical protein